MSTTTATASRVFIARQPIMDRGGRVFAYELRHREPSFAVTREVIPDDRATARVLTDGLQAIGLDALTGGRHAFINISRSFLLHGIPDGLPPASVVFGIGADVEADPDVLQACRQLRTAGYALAIDSFVVATGYTELVELASYVRVNFADAPTTADRQRQLGRKPPDHVALVSTHVETAEAYQQATAEGYKYFHGSFFGKPVVKEGRAVPTQQLSHLRLLRALGNPNLSVHQLAEIIKPDAAMCFRVLRAVNSAAFALRTTVSSIPEALVLLGRDTIRRWVSLWSLAGLSPSNQALLATATLRGRFCELLADQFGRDESAAEGFLLGLCSMLDALLGQPMASIVPELPLSESLRGALLGEDNRYGRLLRCATSWEQGEWDQAIELAEAAGIDAETLAPTYAAAVKWASDLERLASAGSAA